MSLLVRGGHSWVVHRGWWPEGRGSARTLVAGGLPLSEEERVKDFRNPYKLSVFSVFSLLLSLQFTYQSDRALLQTTPLLVLLVSSHQWVMLDFGVPPSPRLSLHWQHREDWGQCTCTSSSYRPSGLVWLWHHSGRTDRTSVIQMLHQLPQILQIKYFPRDIPQGFCCRSQMQQESSVGSWSGWGCLETKSGWPWEVTQGLLSALLTWADSWGKPLAWESPQSPQGPCRKNKGSAVMS